MLEWRFGLCSLPRRRNETGYLRGHGVDACAGGLRQHRRAQLCRADVHRVAASSKTSSHEALDARIAFHARAYKLPESLVHAVVQRESKYNPSLKHGPFWGLMQIRHDTARSMGYTGPADGLLNPETNVTYAVAYLANAFRVAGGDAQRAIDFTPTAIITKPSGRACSAKCAQPTSQTRSRQPLMRQLPQSKSEFPR